MDKKRQLMAEVFNELGIDCTISADNDLNLQEFIADSFSFINFICTVEEKYGIEIPDELLTYDTIQSLNGFLELIDTKEVKPA